MSNIISRERVATYPLGARQEEILSYLQGLGPVGTPVPFDLRCILPDLGFRIRETPYRSLSRLEAKGFVERVTNGNRGDSGLVRVIRRLEDA